MKKIILPFLFLILLSACSEKAPSAEQTIPIVKPIENKITKNGEYALDCKSKYYTTSMIGGDGLVNDSYIEVSEWHEQNTMYVTNESAKFFGATYQVIQDDNSSLVIMRHYAPSWLTETVSIDKNSWIGFDVKTLTAGLSGRPNSDTFILTCSQV
jgi:hypothetical protein